MDQDIFGASSPIFDKEVGKMVVIYAEKSSLAKEIAARSLLRLNMSVLYVVIAFYSFSPAPPQQ